MGHSDDKRDEARNRRGDDSMFDLRGRSVFRVWTLFFLLVLFVLFLLFLWKAIPVLLILFAGSLVALALRFLGDSISQFTRIPPRVALTLVLVVIIALGAIGGYLAAPTLAEQFTELGSNLQESVSELEETVRDTAVGEYLVQRVDGMEEEIEGGELWGRIAGMFTTTIGAISGLSLTLIVGVFLAYNPGLYASGFLRLIPIQKRDRAAEIISELGDTLRWWMVGQLISMLVLTVTTWVMLLLLGVPLAFILGLLTGLLTFIPYLGPIIAAGPILLIAFVESPQLMIWTLVLYLVIQNLEANVLMPIIFQRTVHLPPVLTIVAQVLLGGMFGFVGIILATPLMAAGINLVKMIYVEDVIGDPMDKPVLQKPAG